MIIFENNVLAFLPPYSPELNSANKIEAKYKRAFSSKFYEYFQAAGHLIEAVNDAIKKKGDEYLWI